MTRKNLPKALLVLLGKLPPRIEREQMTMSIMIDHECITVNHLLKAVLQILDESARGREDEEMSIEDKESTSCDQS